MAAVERPTIDQVALAYFGFKSLMIVARYGGVVTFKPPGQLSHVAIVGCADVSGSFVLPYVFVNHGKVNMPVTWYFIFGLSRFNFKPPRISPNPQRQIGILFNSTAKPFAKMLHNPGLNAGPKGAASDGFKVVIGQIMLTTNRVEVPRQVFQSKSDKFCTACPAVEQIPCADNRNTPRFQATTQFVDFKQGTTQSGGPIRFVRPCRGRG